MSAPEVEGEIKTLSLKWEADKWFLVLACEVPEPQQVGNILPVIGLDVGLTHFATSSEGEKISNPRFLKDALPELRRAQRSLSRKKKGGKNRTKVKRQVRRLHARVANLRHEHRHKVSNELISRYGKIAVESLNVQGMLRNPRLARAISDVGWSAFVATLTYKAERAGGEVKQVSPNGTSQECSACGENVPKKLNVRIHRCACGLVLDRDHNAALNILQRAWPGTGQLSSNSAAGPSAQRSCLL
jgi:putative transposase